MSHPTHNPPKTPPRAANSGNRCGPTRREVLENSGKISFLGTASLAGAAGGGCALAIPLLDSLNGPNRQTALVTENTATLEVALEDLAPGQSRIVSWRGWPVFIRRRTPEMLAGLKDPALTALLADPDSTSRQQPPDAANWHRSIHPEYGVLIALCTHLGCAASHQRAGITLGGKMKGVQQPGFFCPCHGSRFDEAGRVLKNMPSRLNLPVPPATLIPPDAENKTGLILKIGICAADPSFTMNDIEKL